MNIPNGHQALMPYLIVNGAKQFIHFTQTVFNAKLTVSKMREEEAVMMHCEIMINDCTIMFCDATPQWKEATGNLFVYVPDADITFQKAIDAGAEVLMPLRNEDYGRTCGVTDPLGNVWWITAVQ